MPLYEYQCDACGHRFEAIRKFSDAPLVACPKCGGALQKLQSAPAFHLKGSGWYITDYARKEQGGATDKPAGDRSDTAEKPEKSEKGDKAEKADKPDKTDRADKAENSGKADTAAKSGTEPATPSSTKADTSTSPSTPSSGSGSSSPTK